MFSPSFLSNFKTSMASEIQLVPVSLATVALESCFYGGFLVLAIMSMCLLVRRRARWLSPTFLGAIGMCITITAHWIITVDRSFQAFLFFQNGTYPLGFYGDLSQITEVVKSAFCLTTLIIGDTIIIHRLWIIWDKRLIVVIFPMLSLLGLVVCSVGITYQFTRDKTGQSVFLSDASRWITSDAVFTICTNIYSTTFISWRMWKVGRGMQPIGGIRIQARSSVLAIIVESAAIYTTWSIFFFATYQSKSNLQFIAIDCLPAITGIACMLIHVRIGLGWAHQGSQAEAFESTGPLSISIAQHTHTAIEDFTVLEIGKLGVGGEKDAV
ncbi:hypothetical protein R3P38DRAFT_2681330 [Favolaschia claudopus]|uniref:Uncharacterized protein n=1 Tax=Favolaschia claudopus TaxID=2862362 RepID=A0AAW0E395_9AGAR